MHKITCICIYIRAKETVNKRIQLRCVQNVSRVSEIFSVSCGDPKRSLSLSDPVNVLGVRSKVGHKHCFNFSTPIHDGPEKPGESAWRAPIQHLTTCVLCLHTLCVKCFESTHRRLLSLEVRGLVNFSATHVCYWKALCRASTNSKY
jgi:hypothetical protein